VHTREHFDEGRLARTVIPDQCNYLARMDIKLDVL
jgi:hypothetical protein